MHKWKHTEEKSTFVVANESKLWPSIQSETTIITILNFGTKNSFAIKVRFAIRFAIT